jgi:hypothetical protein
MAEEDAERFREEAEECRKEADQALSPLDREAWLKLAADWSRLAQQAEQRRSVLRRRPQGSRH